MPTDYKDLDTRVREVEIDFANHEGRSATFWEDQSRTNTATLTGLEKLHTRISTESTRIDIVERKFSWVWGVTAGITGLIAVAAAANRLL